MGEMTLASRFGDVPVWVAVPAGEGPWPGVVVIHDANGMSVDLRNQASWLGAEGYLAAAPDLYRGGAKVRCMIRIMRDLMAGREQQAMDAIETTRSWLAAHERCTGRIGVIGFCMGGGFALMLAPQGRYDAASVNYGGLTDRTAGELARACPIVASYGARDRTLRGAAARLEHILAEHGIPHDVKEYPGAGHGFMNQHPRGDLPWLFVVLGSLSRTGYDAAATRDARRRIVEFFDRHLTG
jgi:carboxymethylenebutenolidase